MSASAPLFAPRPQGLGRAVLGFTRSGDRTVVSRALAQSPMRVLTPRNHGDAAWAYVTHLGGGLLEGDSAQLELHVAAGAKALVASQGHTRVFRSPSGCRAEVAASVEEGGLLVLLPDPLCLYGGARLTQRTRVDLAPTASVLSVDVLASGRSAQGERWAFSELRATLCLTRNGRPVIDETLWLDPRHGELRARLGRFEALATVAVVGPALAPLAEAIAARADLQPPRPAATRVEAWSPLGAGEGVLRLAATSPEAAVHRVRELVGEPLARLLGDDPFGRRF